MDRAVGRVGLTVEPNGAGQTHLIAAGLDLAQACPGEPGRPVGAIEHQTRLIEFGEILVGIMAQTLGAQSPARLAAGIGLQGRESLDDIVGSALAWCADAVVLGQRTQLPPGAESQEHEADPEQPLAACSMLTLGEVGHA